MLEDLTVIGKNKIREESNNFKLNGYRFVAMTCDKEGDDFELTYHFDLNYKVKDLRIIVKPEDTIISISPVFPSALLIENEYQDLYGFKFDGLLIDYKGNLLLAASSPKTPMKDKK